MLLSSGMTKKLDGRQIDHAAMEQIRIRAVQQVQAGENPEVVIKSLGFHRSCIYDWLARYRAGGWDSLRERKATGRKPLLTGDQIQWIYRAITRNDPRQYQFAFALWTRALIKQLIADRFGIELSLPSVGRLLAQLGLSCQRPLFRAYQQNHSLVENWLQRQYPAIKALAKKIGAEIYFGDEAGLRSDHHAGSTWAPIGQTPVVETSGERFSLNMISAISPKGLLRFMIQPGRMAAPQFCEFLNRLMYRARHPVILIVDGHPMHRAKKVKECVAQYNGKLQLFILPPYSPELNPDELVWNDLKGTVGRATVRRREDLEDHILDYFFELKCDRRKIRSFFQAQHTQYAA